MKTPPPLEMKKKLELATGFSYSSHFSSEFLIPGLAGQRALGTPRRPYESASHPLVVSTRFVFAVIIVVFGLSGGAAGFADVVHVRPRLLSN